MVWEVGGRFKRERTYVHLWLIHVDVWQKSTQYCKVIILQLKIQKTVGGTERMGVHAQERREEGKEVKKKEIGRQKKDKASN